MMNMFVKMMNTFVNTTNLRLTSGRLTNLYLSSNLDEVFHIEFIISSKNSNGAICNVM
jgi:hypothetical protein